MKVLFKQNIRNTSSSHKKQTNPFVRVCLRRMRRKYVIANQLFFWFLFSFCQSCVKVTWTTLHYSFNVKFLELWQGIFLRIALNYLL